MYYPFFHGWQRKVGCVALLISLPLASLWMRSHRIDDAVFFTVGDRRHRLRSVDGQLSWAGWPPQGWQGIHRTSERTDEVEFEDVPMWVYSWGREIPPNSLVQWQISQKYVTAPLALLSTCLILWKPRKR